MATLRAFVHLALILIIGFLCLFNFGKLGLSNLFFGDFWSIRLSLEYDRFFRDNFCCRNTTIFTVCEYLYLEWNFFHHFHGIKYFIHNNAHTYTSEASLPIFITIYKVHESFKICKLLLKNAKDIFFYNTFASLKKKKEKN